MAIKFDLNTELMADVTEDKFVSATLALYVANDSKGTEKTSAYRIKRDWKVEEASWRYAKKDTYWQDGEADSLQGGGDTTTNLSTVEYAERETWEKYDVTKAVKDYIKGEENYGFLIISDDRNGWTHAQYRKYVSSENKNEKLRPKLIVTTKDTKIIGSSSPMGLTGRKLFTLTNSVINLSVPFKNYRITISNTKGQELISLHANSNHVEIPIEGLTMGVHVMNIFHEQGIESMRFIITK